jgi:Nucleotidyl transferase
MRTTEQLWRRALLREHATVGDVIRNLDQVAIKIVLVTDQIGTLQGTISDGDVRRGLLKGLDLSSPITDIIHRDALVAPEGMGRDLVMQLMIANKIQQVPVVDENHTLVGLHLWEQISTPSARPNAMVIMAGGKGVRLRPYTEDCPKPMLKVAGKPMLEHIIERAKSDGFAHFILAIHYLGEMVEAHFGNGERLGVRIEYVRETTPLGTAGALSLLAPAPHLPFVVTNAMSLPTFITGNCSISTFVTMPPPPWRCAYTNGNILLAWYKPKDCILLGLRKSRSREAISTPGSMRCRQRVSTC